MNAPARVSHYGEFLEVCRQRVTELEITYQTLNAIAGWQEGYAEKLFCIPPIKRMGPMTMFECCQALALGIIAQPCPELLERVKNRLQKRIRPRMLGKASMIYLTPDSVKQNGTKGGYARAAKLTERRRKQIARRAALVRWADVKETCAAARIVPKSVKT